MVILNIWKAYVDSNYDPEWAKKNYLNEKCLEEAKNVRLDILEVLSNRGINISPETKPVIKKDALGKAITVGLIGNLMSSSKRNLLKKLDGKKIDINIHPNSIFNSKSLHEGTLLVSNEIFMNNKGKSFACDCLIVKPEWLCEIAPEIARNITRKHNNKDKYHHRNVYDHHRHKKRY